MPISDFFRAGPSLLPCKPMTVFSVRLRTVRRGLLSISACVLFATPAKAEVYWCYATNPAPMQFLSSTFNNAEWGKSDEIEARFRSHLETAMAPSGGPYRFEPVSVECRMFADLASAQEARGAAIRNREATGYGIVEVPFRF